MKKTILPIVAASAVLFGGCSSVDSVMERVIMERSGIYENEEYLQYQEYKEAGKLDEDNQYIYDEEDSSSVAADGSVHVTFAENRYLKVDYYTDEKMMNQIDESGCYLNPGDTIYGKVTECTNPYSNLYELSEYRIAEYDADGNRKAEYSQEAEDGTLEYNIPSDFTGTELSVMPVGEYRDRSLSMEVYCCDDSGNETPLSNAGTWTVNDETISGNSAEISPVEDYILKYDYDDENYFFVSSEPECFTKDPVGLGSVEFWEAKSTDENISYRVELHNYLNLEIQFDQKAKVSYNGEEVETISKNKKWSRDKLKYGDIITVETAGKCTITDGAYRHVSVTKDQISDGDRYTFTVTKEASDSKAESLTETVDVNREFTVTLDPEGNYGSCSYKLNGEEQSGTIKVREGQKLELTYKITEDGYEFAESADGIKGMIDSIIKSKERTAEIPIDAELDGKTIHPDDYIQVTKKGE